MRGEATNREYILSEEAQAQGHRAETPYLELERARQILVLIFLAAAGWYLAWRPSTFNREALWFSRLIFGAEVYGFCTTLMHLFMTWRLTVREAPEPQAGFTVDVFVTTINESPALLRKTLLAVLKMEYPHRTWLLDDGRRPEMKALAEELGCGYLTRKDNSDAKAGNLNNALSLTSGEFIAVFDADHAPKKNFLLRTLGYFRDSSVAFVQTPQDFYNLDSFQHHRKRERAVAWHEQSVFFRVIQRGKDYWNAAFFCGSCAIIRRAALEAIGGFAAGTVTEDLHTSVRFHKKGFRSVFHAEPVAFGLAPAGVEPFLKQRVRWGQGAMQVWRKEGVFFCRGLTMAQRINYVASSVTYFDGWQKGLFYLTPAIVLVSGVMPLTVFGRDFLFHFVPYFLLTFLVFEEVNRGYGRSIVIEQYNMSRFAAMAWSTMGIFKKVIRFAVTPKGRGNGRRFSTYLVPQTFILAVNASAIAVGIFLFLHRHHLPVNAVIANVVWALINTALAAGVIRFTVVHARFRRGDYRFNIPFPALITFSDGKNFYGTVDDISSAGFRLYSALPDSIAPETAFVAELYLPSGPLRFDAVVKSLIKGVDGKESYVKAIGCAFDWKVQDNRDELDSFLYGSDTQLVLNKLKEAIRTPLSWMGIKSIRGQVPVEEGETTWSAMVYTAAGNPDPKAGLVGASLEGSGTRSVVAYAPLAHGEDLTIKAFGRRGVLVLAGRVEHCETVDTQLSPLYLLRLRLHEAVPAAPVQRTFAGTKAPAAVEDGEASLYLQ